MSALTDIKTKVVNAIKGLSEFSANTDDVYPRLAVGPLPDSQQAASKMGPLSAYVSIEAIEKTEDRSPLKTVSVFIDLWINPFSGTNDPETIVDDAESIVGAVITGIEDLETEAFPDGATKHRLAFQNARRAPNEVLKTPILVYRIIAQTETVLGNA